MHAEPSRPLEAAPAAPDNPRVSTSAEQGARPSQLRLGCALWGHAGWNGSLYPRGTRPERRLERYAQRLGTVEVNSTFYALPKPQTLAHWAESVDAPFRFVPKVPRDISHDEPRASHPAELLEFARYLEPLSAQLGPVLLQLGPKAGPERWPALRALCEAWPAERPALALELRHPSWFAPELAPRWLEEARALGLGRCILDSRSIHAHDAGGVASIGRNKPAVPLLCAPTTQTQLVRFVGHPDLPRNATWIGEWAARIHGWLDEGKDVYWFAHCPVEDMSPFLALALERALLARGAPIEASALGDMGREEQAELFDIA